MKIDTYNVSTNSQHSFQRIEFNENRYTAVSNSTLLPSDYKNQISTGDKADISEQAKPADTEAQNQNNVSADEQNEQDNAATQNNPQKILSLQAVKASKIPDFAASVQDTKIKLLEQMISAITGKKFKLNTIKISDNYKSDNPDKTNDLMNRLAKYNSEGQSEQKLVGYSLESEHLISESETMDYQAQGNIKTADGRNITVDVNLHMSRSYTSYEHTSIALKKTVVDPLVVNFGGNAAALTGETFDFDLNLDGIKDKIHFATEGSGFLALDKNGDGIINDGSELFGPNTGSGFEELRMYDTDGNGWIDENDEIFDQLKVWSKDKDGNDQLFSLKEVDVGAIYLGETKTQFSMNDNSNNVMGAVRSSSFFLKESGGAGTVNHIDLAL